MSHRSFSHQCPGWRVLLPVWLMLLTLLVNSCAGGQSYVYRVGILAVGSFFTEAIDGFKTRMTELGYVEGQNIRYDIQQTGFDQVAYTRVLSQFVTDEVDLIFAFPTAAAFAAKTSTQGTDIPVVFGFSLTEGTDLVANVNEPGGNVTGVRFPATDIALKRFEIMRELVPAARRIWMPYQRDYATIAIQLEALYPAAASEGVTLMELPAANADELTAAFQAQATTIDIDADQDAILLLAEPLATTPDAFAVITGFAAEHQIPIGGSIIPANSSGSIFGIDVNKFGGGQQAASLAHKIFQGTPVGSIPVVATEIQLLIDYTATQQLGITVPEGLLHQADEVIR